MATFWVLAILNTLIRYSCSATITQPTSTDGDNQYFDTKSTTNNYQYDTIICSSPYCHIICDVPGGCFRTTIDASSSQSLTIKCDKNSACESLSISGEPSTNFDLYCADDIQACFSTDIIVPTTTNVNIICNYTSITSTNGVCSNLELNATQSSTVNIQCLGSYSCYSSSYMVTKANSVTLTADGNNATQSIEIYGQKISDDLTVSCEASSCPLSKIYANFMDGTVNLDCMGHEACFGLAVSATDMTTRYTYS